MYFVRSQVTSATILPGVEQRSCPPRNCPRKVTGGCSISGGQVLLLCISWSARRVSPIHRTNVPQASEMASDRSHRRHHMKKHHAVKESSESEDSEVSPKNSSRSPGVSTDSRKKKSATMLSVFGVPSLPATEARRRALNSVSNRNIHQRPMDTAAIGEPAGVLEGEVIRKSRRERTESTEGAPRQRIEDEQRVHHRVHEERAQDSNQARNAEKLTSGSVGAVGRVTGDIGFSDAKEAALSAGDPLRTTVAAYVVEDDAKKKKKKKRKKKKKSKKKKKRKKKKKSKRKKKKKKSKKKKKKRKKKKSKKKKKKKKKKKSQSPDSTATSAASSSPTVSQAPPTSQTSLPATKVGLASTPSTRSTQTDDLLRSMRSRIQREAYLPPPNEGPRHSRRHRRRSSSEGSGSSSGSVKKYRIVTHVVLGNARQLRQQWFAEKLPDGPTAPNAPSECSVQVLVQTDDAPAGTSSRGLGQASAADFFPMHQLRGTDYASRCSTEACHHQNPVDSFSAIVKAKCARRRLR
ncbi:hypothetical protein HPB48_016167 [Haemaphysalis longicornis]|uniref:Uncharacterized protein n=1 Tax=Haemaphysalis longicornis TaxID=44386 RepID=A0A9J6G6H5_HAELO|nr:hypothetical protein HPB48_016167 [Haemaphysalis longicornis]